MLKTTSLELLDLQLKLALVHVSSQVPPFINIFTAQKNPGEKSRVSGVFFFVIWVPNLFTPAPCTGSDTPNLFMR